MLAIDWLGCLLSGGGLALLLRGPQPLVRTGVALLLGEIGRVMTVLLLGGDLLVLTVGGAFTRMEVSGPAATAAQVGGPLAGVVLGLLLGRRAAADTLVYSLIAGGVNLLILI